MPKSKIKSFDFKRESSASFGAFYIFIMELEDGTKGDYFSKEREIKKNIGDEIEYTYEPNANPQYLGKIKEVPKPNNNFKAPKNESAENARVSLQVAIQHFNSSESLGGTPIHSKVLDFAERYFQWLQSKK